LSSPIVGIARKPAGRGYWLVAANGRVFAFGDAHHRGGLHGAQGAKGRAVAIAAPAGGGYWVASQR
jgi:hypothetical protein